jgi:predicted nucleotidyltransferase
MKPQKKVATSKAKKNAKKTPTRTSLTPKKSDWLSALYSRLAKLFRNKKVRWQVIGAQALLAHGIARATQDVDITVEAKSIPLNDLLTSLGQIKIVPRVPVEEQFVYQSRVLLLIDGISGSAIDFVFADGGLDSEFLSRAIQVKLGKVSFPVVSVNDLILMKLIAQREKDVEDIRLIFRAKTKGIDVDFLREQVALFGSALDDSNMALILEEAIESNSSAPK